MKKTNSIILERPKPKTHKKSKARDNSENIREFLKRISINITRENQENIEHIHVHTSTGCYRKDQSKNKKSDPRN